MHWIFFRITSRLSFNISNQDGRSLTKETWIPLAIVWLIEWLPCMKFTYVVADSHRFKTKRCNWYTISVTKVFKANERSTCLRAFLSLAVTWLWHVVDITHGMNVWYTTAMTSQWIIFTFVMLSPINRTTYTCLGHSIYHEFTWNLFTLILAYEYYYKVLHFRTFQS